MLVSPNSTAREICGQGCGDGAQGILDGCSRNQIFSDGGGRSLKFGFPFNTRSLLGKRFVQIKQ